MKICVKIMLLLFAVVFLLAGCAKNTLIVDAPEKGDANIVDAARKGDMKEIERLIAAGADVNAKDSSGETPLHEAAYWGNEKVAEFLISKGADVNAKDSSGETPLHEAAFRDNKEVAALLISKGVDVNAKDNAGDTPLHKAVYSGKKEVPEFLISKGADVNGKGKNGFTPLHDAAYFGTKEVAEFLLSKGADVTAKDNEGKTPLDLAMEKDLTSVVSLLEEAVFTEEMAAFTDAVRNYQAATVKPTLSEKARRFKVQAEYAFSKKDFDGAVARYKEALDVAPWWPEGHFNRALILGELSRYRDAIREMKKYLTLVPDAPNARTAQDNIYRWEAELK